MYQVRIKYPHLGVRNSAAYVSTPPHHTTRRYYGVVWYGHVGRTDIRRRRISGPIFTTYIRRRHLKKRAKKCSTYQAARHEYVVPVCNVRTYCSTPGTAAKSVHNESFGNLPVGRTSLSLQNLKFLSDSDPFFPSYKHSILRTGKVCMHIYTLCSTSSRCDFHSRSGWQHQYYYSSW